MSSVGNAEMSNANNRNRAEHGAGATQSQIAHPRAPTWVLSRSTPRPAGINRGFASAISTDAPDRETGLQFPHAAIEASLSHLPYRVLRRLPLALFVACNAITLDRLAQWFRQGDGVITPRSLRICWRACACSSWSSRSWHIGSPSSRWRSSWPSRARRRRISFRIRRGSSISSMVQNTVHTDPTEVRQLLSWQMISYVVLLTALPTLLILAAEITFSALRTLLARLAETDRHRAMRRAGIAVCGIPGDTFEPAMSRTNTSSIRWCPSTSSRAP